MKKHFLIGDVSKLMNIPKPTLRYYDQKGILSPQIKGENGYRYYSEEQLILLKEIKMMRDLELPLQEIKKFLNNSEPDNILEILDETLIKIRNKINTFQIIEKNILDDIRIFHKKNRMQLNIPFLEEVETEEMGVEIFNFKNKDKRMLAKIAELEKKNIKIIKSIVKTSEENLQILEKDLMNEEREINEIGYAIVEEKKLNNKLVINKGKYISIYGKGSFREEPTFSILKKYIEDNGLKIKNNDIYISFQVSILCRKKENILFKMRILLE